ncbi:hypothetical protein FD14_GL002354 [Secundilactobacillus similis DSM 23365 = JCM 2765]|uniref:Uncharacterized protein n=1 Tax=Secundilactobacillus similis DSM 23365 = JCM 2765 TaxID=1423804 RepID=A0A0R2FDN4_9LACO|nr:hypothetical protein FD14_GL002354 [Secundilactobacillus similis DSM 23365 = JCM 2765]
MSTKNNQMMAATKTFLAIGIKTSATMFHKHQLLCLGSPTVTNFPTSLILSCIIIMVYAIYEFGQSLENVGAT